jgi:hypothetical protein
MVVPLEWVRVKLLIIERALLRTPPNVTLAVGAVVATSISKHKKLLLASR